MTPRPGEAKRILLERLERTSQSLQVEKELGAPAEPEHTFEEVMEMIHAHLEESRIRREENEKRMAERRWPHAHPTSRFST
jgi:hypothetical protein